MPNPLSALLPVFDTLGREIKILPAAGGAVEDLQHPDQDEIEDAIINRDDNVIVDFAEDPTPNTKDIYRCTPPLPRTECHYFRYFIDGSIRTYFLATGIEGRRSFPIELAQVGSALITREDNGQLKAARNIQKVLLLLPKHDQGISDSLWNEIRSLDKPDWLDIVDFTLSDRLADSKNDPRDKAGARARSEMHRLEIELMKFSDDMRNENAWLVLDGAVRFIEDEVWEHWREMGNPHLIGVAKSFRKDPTFQLGRRSSTRKDITSIIASLPHAHRTVAFSAYNGRVAFWYVRLREQREVDYPLMGVVKVEIPRPNQESIPAELADKISRALVAERNVTPYGLDRRWHCSLYPIYIAEQVIKSRFYSRDVLMGCIKWPRHQSGGVE